MHRNIWFSLPSLELFLNCPSSVMCRSGNFHSPNVILQNSVSEIEFVAIQDSSNAWLPWRFNFREPRI